MMLVLDVYISGFCMTILMFQAEILRRDVSHAASQLDNALANYEDTEALYLARVESASKSPTPKLPSYHRSLADVLAIQDEIQLILRENSDLVGQFETLTLALTNANNVDK
jgi:hypothetical protein